MSCSPICYVFRGGKDYNILLLTWELESVSYKETIVAFCRNSILEAHKIAAEL